MPKTWPVSSSLLLHYVCNGQNKKMPVFRVTLPYLNFLLKPIFFQVVWKIYNFSEKKNKTIYEPTLTKMFRPVTLNTTFFYSI